MWDFAWDGDSSTVTVHVRRLREKIEDDPSEPRHLVTVWGVGYRFEPMTRLRPAAMLLALVAARRGRSAASSRPRSV